MSSERVATGKCAPRSAWCRPLRLALRRSLTSQRSYTAASPLEGTSQLSIVTRVQRAVHARARAHTVTSELQSLALLRAAAHKRTSALKLDVVAGTSRGAAHGRQAKRPLAVRLCPHCGDRLALLLLDDGQRAGLDVGDADRHVAEGAGVEEEQDNRSCRDKLMPSTSWYSTPMASGMP